MKSNKTLSRITIIKATWPKLLFAAIVFISILLFIQYSIQRVNEKEIYSAVLSAICIIFLLTGLSSYIHPLLIDLYKNDNVVIEGKKIKIGICTKENKYYIKYFETDGTEMMITLNESVLSKKILNNNERIKITSIYFTKRSKVLILIK